MPLFVLLSGIGFTLLMRSTGGRPAAVLGRAVFLLMLGLLMSGTVPMVVILQFYALYLVVGLLVHRLGDRALLALIVAAAAAGVAVQVWMINNSSGPSPAASSPIFGDLRLLIHPGDLLQELFVTGVYPLLPDGAVFFLLGMWLGRRRLTNRRTAIQLILAGVLLVGLGTGFSAAINAMNPNRLPASGPDQGAEFGVTSPAPSGDPEAPPSDVDPGVDPGIKLTALQLIADDSPHSHMPPWLLSATGIGLASLGLCLLAARKERWLRPATALGRLTLTAYVGHALILRWAPTSWWADHPVLATIALWVLFAGFALAWTRWSRTGPLEHVIRACGQLTGRLVDTVRAGRTAAAR